MLAGTGVIAVALIIYFTVGRSLVKQKQKKEWGVFLSILLIAAGLSIGVILKWPIPSPTVIIGKVLEPVVEPIRDWTKGEST
jgi:hypothetical protein